MKRMVILTLKQMVTHSYQKSLRCVLYWQTLPNVSF